MNQKLMRKKWSMPGLIKELKTYFKGIVEPVTNRGSISISDSLMSGVSGLFSLKYPSLLQFDKSKRETAVAHNLKNLYQIETIPCDTYLRERLDKLPPDELQGAFTTLIRQAQRGKALERFSYYEDHYLLSIDGTGYFSEPNIHCEQCCEKHHRNGDIT